MPDASHLHPVTAPRPLGPDAPIPATTSHAPAARALRALPPAPIDTGNLSFIRPPKFLNTSPPPFTTKSLRVFGCFPSALKFLLWRILSEIHGEGQGGGLAALTFLLQLRLGF